MGVGAVDVYLSGSGGCTSLAVRVDLGTVGVITALPVA